MTKYVLLLLVSCTCASAESKPHMRLRRLALVAACATTVLDAWATNYAVRNGAWEGNSLFVNYNRISWSRMIGFKAAFCGSPILAGELLKHRRLDMGFVIGGFAETATFGAASVPNYRLGKRLEQINNIQPGQLAPLK